VSSGEKLPALDGLRAISILLVLGAHLLPLGPKSLQLNETAGAMGMSLFFALSGFLIVMTLRRNADAFEFVVRRLARILPLAYLYLLLVSILMHFDPGWVLATGAFLVNYYFGYLTIDNGHFWSLCVEVHFYVAMALIVLAAGKRGIWIVWPACIVVTGLRMIDGAYINIQTHLRVDEILAGACVATVYRPVWMGTLQRSWLVVVLAVMAWIASAWPQSGAFQYLRPYATVLLLTAVLCNGDKLLTELLTSRPMRYIASISYALYVLHPLTAFGWWNDGSVFERYLFKRPLTFVITFVSAHISTFHWERRWIEGAANWIEGRRARLRATPGVSFRDRLSGALER
jgi:peptidoglycan/LPS O-acetylase OafA/YrhL